MFRGVRVAPGWPTKIREAQSIKTCRPNGVEKLMTLLGRAYGAPSLGGAGPSVRVINPVYHRH